MNYRSPASLSNNGTVAAGRTLPGQQTLCSPRDFSSRAVFAFTSIDPAYFYGLRLHCGALGEDVNNLSGGTVNLIACRIASQTERNLKGGSVYPVNASNVVTSFSASTTIFAHALMSRRASAELLTELDLAV